MPMCIKDRRNMLPKRWKTSQRVALEPGKRTWPSKAGLKRNCKEIKTPLKFTSR